jgi:hypothetical protein
MELYIPLRADNLSISVFISEGISARIYLSICRSVHLLDASILMYKVM